MLYLTTKCVFENFKGRNCLAVPPAAPLDATLLFNNKQTQPAHSLWRTFNVVLLKVGYISRPCMCNSLRNGEAVQSVGLGHCVCLLTGPHA